jgi:hypothetical protein
MHPGGIADKVGNRYEALWLIRHLLELIDGRAHAIMIEPVGDAGIGVEFAVERGNGTEWHQAKRQTSSSWTIPRLASEGVLATFQGKLAASGSNSCVFVSTDPAKPLRLLKDKQPTAANPDAFERTLSEAEQTEWQKLQQSLGLNKSESFAWLERCDFFTYPERELGAAIVAECDRWFAADPEAVIDTLRRWVEDDHNFNRPLRRQELLDTLSARTIALKQYEIDRTIPGKIEAANRHYDESYRPIGAGLFDIDRAEVDVLTAALADPEGPKVIALAGPAGSGKSVIVRKALERIDPDRPALVFRIDQVGGIASLAALGEATIEVSDSPAVVLEQLAGRAVLFIDQADAVSEMSGRTATVRNVLLRMLRQARFYPDLQVVFSCRSFDLDNDHEFRAIARAPHALRIDIGPLRWTEDVLPVLVKLGIGIQGAGTKVQALLCQPIGLALVADLASTAPLELAHVEHIGQLYDALLAMRDAELRKIAQPGWSLYEALTALAEAMNQREQLAAPVAVLDRFPGAVQHLQQNGLIVVQSQRVSLMHETLFDYLHARAFVSDGKGLQKFLLGSEQTLFRRTQVRQILAMERDLDRKTYLADLAFILDDKRVRAHVRDLVLRWLSTLPDPSLEEWRLVEESGRGDSNLPRHVGRVIYGGPSWVCLLAQLGILDAWFASDDDEDLYWALRAVEITANGANAKTAEILDRFLELRPDKATVLLRSFAWFQPERPLPALADVLIKALSLCSKEEFEAIDQGPFTLADGWVKNASDEAARIYAATFATWYRLNPEGTPFRDDHSSLNREFHHLNELFEANPIAALSAILPAMRIAMERTELEEDFPREDGIWAWRRKDQGEGPHLVEFIDIVRGGLSRLASTSPEVVQGLLDILDPARHMTALHLVLEAVSANPVLAPLLAAQIDNPGLFKAGWHHADAYSAGKAMATCWPHLTAAERGVLEGRLMSLWPELDHAGWCIRQFKAPEEENGWPIKDLKAWARRALRNTGMRQWSTFRQLADVDLSPPARRRAQELERKFVGRRPEEPDGIRSSVSRSPISSEQAKRMDDKAWRTAFATDWSERRRWRDAYFGDASDLARVVQEEAKADPNRFLALYWTLPCGTPQPFVRAILWGVAETGLDAAALDDLIVRLRGGEPWQADDSTRLWLIGQRSGEAIGPEALAELSRIAREGNFAKAGEMSRNKKDKPEPLFKVALEQGHYLAWQGRQTPRGDALHKLGLLAWNDRAIFDANCDAVDILLGKDLPDWLIASALLFVRSAIKHEPSTAARWMEAISRSTPITLASEYGRQSLIALDAVAPEQGRTVLLALLHGDDPGMSALAAALIVARSFDTADWDHEREKILSGPDEWRAGGAQVVVEQIKEDCDEPQLRELIIKFFDDPAELVRDRAADVFRRISTAAMGRYADLYRAFLSSPYFEGERTYFMHRLEEAPAELDEFVLELLELAVAKLPKAGSARGSIGYRLWEPLMRIYASHDGDPAMRKRCLDLVDQLVANDIGGSDKLSEATR